MPRHSRALLRRALAGALLFLRTQAALRAHDVPEGIDIQSYVKVQGSNLQVVLRVPLLAITDTNLPKDGTGYLAMPYLDPALGEAANQISTGILFLENDERLQQFGMASARISLPSDKSFDSYDAAVAHVRGPKLPDSTQLYYNQGYLDLELLYPIQSWSGEFGVQVLLSRGLANRTVTFVNYVRPDGRISAFRLVDQTGIVHLDPSWIQAVRVFVADGFFRFLDSLDHLLFLIVLALSFNTGLELGLIIILAITLPAVGLLFTQVMTERAGTIVISVVAGHTAWHWMTARYSTLQLMSLPALDAALAATIVRWLLVLTV